MNKELFVSINHTRPAYGGCQEIVGSPVKGNATYAGREHGHWWKRPDSQPEACVGRAAIGHRRTCSVGEGYLFAAVGRRPPRERTYT